MVKIKRLMLTLMAVVLCMTAIFPTALATGGEYQKEELPAETVKEQTVEPAKDKEKAASTEQEKPAEKETEKDKSADKEAEKKSEAPKETEKAQSDTAPLTPKGNLTLVDDQHQTTDAGSDEPENKQFITLQSKSGNEFYLIIDRSGKEENVYFLNLVDEADLMALIEEPEEEPAVCTCTDKCAVGSIDTNCPVCSVNLSQCLGVEPEAEEEEPDEEDAHSGIGLSGLFLFVVLGAAGGAIYYFKFRKPKADTKGPDDLDEYDFGDDDETYEYEDDSEYASDEETTDEEGE